MSIPLSLSTAWQEDTNALKKMYRLGLGSVAAFVKLSHSMFL